MRIWGHPTSNRPIGSLSTHNEDLYSSLNIPQQAQDEVFANKNVDEFEKFADSASRMRTTVSMFREDKKPLETSKYISSSLNLITIDAKHPPGCGGKAKSRHHEDPAAAYGDTFMDVHSRYAVKKRQLTINLPDSWTLKPQTSWVQPPDSLPPADYGTKTQ